MVQAGGVSVNVIQIGEHRVDRVPAHSGGCCVVGIDIHKTSPFKNLSEADSVFVNRVPCRSAAVIVQIKTYTFSMLTKF
jgi:hypothetical protein